LLKRQALRRLRRRGVRLVFQDPMTRLQSLLRVGEHLTDTLAAHRPRWARQGFRQRALDLLERRGDRRRALQQLPP